MINKRQFDRLVSLVDDAKKNGAKLVTGMLHQKLHLSILQNSINLSININMSDKITLGGEKDKFGDLYYKPTILTGVGKDMDCFKEEIFGPVVSILKFNTEVEAVTLANDTKMGLAAYFFSTNVNQCWRVARKMEAGIIAINDGLVSCAEGSFGGFKESGIGREGSKYGIDEYTEMKSITFGNII